MSSRPTRQQTALTALRAADERFQASRSGPAVEERAAAILAAVRAGCPAAEIAATLQIHAEGVAWWARHARQLERDTGVVVEVAR